MLTLYLVCLVVGGLLVTLTIFGGADTDVDTDFAIDGDIDAAAAEGVELVATPSTLRWLTLRNLVFFAAFFGLAGTLFTTLGFQPLLTPPIAIICGTAAAASVHYLMQHLGANESGAVPDTTALEGALAEVVINIDDARCGKIVVKNGDRTLQLLARAHAEAEIRSFATGDEVVIVALVDGLAEVAGTRFLALTD